MSDFKGQAKFRKLAETDFAEMYAVIQSSDTFQDGWKELTGMPQKGNHNPNYKDCLVYIQEVLLRDLHKTQVCPSLPVETRVDDRRWRMDDEMYWHLMFELCSVYELFVDLKIKKPKRLVDWLYDHGYIKPFDNDYDHLRSLVCNPCSDTQVEKVEQ
jgi:hypothetical protein